MEKENIMEQDKEKTNPKKEEEKTGYQNLAACVQTMGFIWGDRPY
jgi:hypothetical protein